MFFQTLHEIWLRAKIWIFNRRRRKHGKAEGRQQSTELWSEQERPQAREVTNGEAAAMPPLPLPELAPLAPSTPPAAPHAAPGKKLLGKPITRPEVSELEKNRQRYDVFLDIKKATRAVARGPSSKPPHIEKPPPTPEAESPPAFDPLGNFVIAQKTDLGDKVRIAESELSGEFNFRDTILDQLDRYFFYLKRMKKRDPEAYGYYRKVGATILPHAATSWEKLQFQFLKHREREKHEPGHERFVTPSFLRDLPAFGCFAYGTDTITENYGEQVKGKPGFKRWIPRFLYFTKYHERFPPDLQAALECTIYKVTVFWDRPQDPTLKRSLGGGGVPQEYGIAVDKEGGVHALKSYTEHSWSCRTKQVDRYRKKIRRASINKKRWMFPDIFSTHKGETQADVLRDVFAMCSEWHEGNAMSMFRVSVKNAEGLTATFGINALRSPYFFADRDVTINSDGRRRPVFHIVKPHIRANGDRVKAHFRGERHFSWAGYDVTITVPGLHHWNIAEYNVGCNDYEKKQPGTIGQAELGDHIALILAGRQHEAFKFTNRIPKETGKGPVEDD